MNKISIKYFKKKNKRADSYYHNIESSINWYNFIPKDTLFDKYLCIYFLLIHTGKIQFSLSYFTHTQKYMSKCVM